MGFISPDVDDVRAVAHHRSELDCLGAEIAHETATIPSRRRCGDASANGARRRASVDWPAGSGRPDKGMPARADLSDQQLKDIAAFLRSVRTSGRDPGRNRPATIVTGDASAGQQYFAAKCATCHSVTGDLRGVASKYADPRQLQQVWLSGTAAGGRGAVPTARPKPTTITVTLPTGEKVESTQARLDDFIVSLTLPSRATRTFVRNGD